MSFSDIPHAPPEGIADDFLDQLFSGPPSSTAGIGAGGFQLGLILDERRAVFTISEEAVLSMSRLSVANASAVAELVPVIPLQWIKVLSLAWFLVPVQDNSTAGGGTKQLVWEKWLNVDSRKWQVAKLIVQDVGEAMPISNMMLLPKPDAPS